MFVRSGALSLVLALAGAATIPYSYDPASQNGPENWPLIDTTPFGSVNECGGKKNSPVALTNGGCTKYEDYIMRPGSCSYEDMEFVVNNHGVKTNFIGDCEKPSLEVPGVDDVFYAAQFHIHTGSEHTIDGVTFGAELHIVHLNADSSAAAVVGKKLNPASLYDSEEFGFLLNGWMDVHNAQQTACAETCDMMTSTSTASEPTRLVNPYALVGEGQRFFNYEGGLTNPPCTEFVNWNLSDEPLAISVQQYRNLVNIIRGYKEDCKPATLAYNGSTSRPVQPLNGRVPIKICPKDTAPASSMGY